MKNFTTFDVENASAHDTVTTNRGFTLIEMVVAVGVFTVVMVIAVGALLAVIDVNRKAQSTKTALNNVNFALDAMAREIRVGNRYQCVRDNGATVKECGAGGLPAQTGFEFTTDEDDETTLVRYRLNDDTQQIERQIGNGPFQALTATDVTITDLQFSIEGQSLGDREQPRVLIVIRGIAGDDPDAQTELNLQTLVSQRFPDDNDN